MLDNAFEDGRKIEKIIQEIECTKFLIDTSCDLWADEVNLYRLSNLHEWFLILAKKYDLPQNEIDRINVSVSPYFNNALGMA